MASSGRAASFPEAAKAVLIGARSGFAGHSPDALLASWTFFVESCEKGYTFNWWEFTNDRDVRGAIEILLGHDELWTYPEWEPWARGIADVDARYRAIVVPIPRHDGPWWESTIPRRAGHELVGDVLRIHGLQLEER